MSNLFLVKGNQNTCVLDASVLSIKKANIDKTKSDINLTTAKREQLRYLEEDYEAHKKRYEEAGCGKDALKDKCFQLQHIITSRQSSISRALVAGSKYQVAAYQADLDKSLSDFKSSNCDAKISQIRGEYAMSVSDEFKKMDKERIEAEIKNQQKQRLLFSVIVFFGAVLMITMLSKNK
jgi:hypothetical protein